MAMYVLISWLYIDDMLVNNVYIIKYVYIMVIYSSGFIAVNNGQ